MHSRVKQSLTVIGLTTNHADFRITFTLGTSHLLSGVGPGTFRGEGSDIFGDLLGAANR